MAYDVFGTGPDILFIHGWAGSRLHWKLASQYIHGYRLWALDLLGFGDSDDPDTKLSFEDHAELIWNFVRKQEIRETIIVGHSVGGMIAATFAILHPFSVSKLVLIEAPVREELAHLTIPILLVFGDAACITFGSSRHEIAKEQANYSTKARVGYVADAGHNPMLEKPREFYDILNDFLK